MKELVKGNLKVIEIKEGHIYQGKKLTKNNIWRKFTTFNSINLEEALKYCELKRR